MGPNVTSPARAESSSTVKLLMALGKGRVGRFLPSIIESPVPTRFKPEKDHEFDLSNSRTLALIDHVFAFVGVDGVVGVAGRGKDDCL